jgi:hypothetical protein
MDLRLARRSPINSLMTTKRSALDWGDPDAITIFNPGNQGRYRDLLWGTPDAITLFNPDHPDG